MSEPAPSVAAEPGDALQPTNGAASRAWLAAGVVVSLAPLVHLVVALRKHTLDVPLWDEWELTPLVVRVFDGSLDFGSLWAQHNEHRIFFPKLWLLTLARGTRWSMGWEIAGNILVATLLLFFVARKAQRTLADEGSRSFPFALPILSWLVFSQVQWENWISGWQIQIWLAVLTFTLATFFLSRSPLRARELIAAVAFALVGTFSFADGVLAWPVLFLALFVGVKSWNPRRDRAIWAGVGALAVGVYLVGYRTPTEHGSPLDTLRSPLRVADYILRFLGKPLVSFSTLAQQLVGFSGILIAVAGGRALVRRGLSRERLLPWLALAVWSCACAGLAALGRAGMGEGMGPRQASAPRYATLSTPLWIADVVILFLIARRENGGKLERVAPRVALGAVFVLVAVNSILKSAEMSDAVEERRNAATLVTTGDIATLDSDKIALLLPPNRARPDDVARLRARILELRRCGLGPFRDR